MLPKFVPIPDPGLVDLVTDVISINPTGVKNASPSLNCKGEPPASSWAGGVAAVGDGAAGSGVNVGAAAGADGTIGFVLATSPIAGCAFTGTPAFTAIPSLAFNSLICFC